MYLSEPNQKTPSILIIDDNPNNLHVLVNILKKEGYRIRPVLEGRLALQAAEIDAPDLVLLDILMPEMDGFEVCRKLKENLLLKEIPVIFITALSNTDAIVKGFLLGAADYITKPFRTLEVLARVSNCLKIRQLQRELEKYNLLLQNLVQAQVREISEAQMSTIFGIAKLAEYRDDDAGTHLVQVRETSKLVALWLARNSVYRDRMQGKFIEDLYNSCPLHDIGKVGIPDKILLKPGKLDPGEFELMKTHSSIGARTLEEVNKRYKKNSFVVMGIEIARSHHEKWDGSGYPQGLFGEQIPLSARITAIVDVYDALRSRRVYKLPLTHEKSREIIYNECGKHFDPVIVDAFRTLETSFDELYVN